MKYAEKLLDPRWQKKRLSIFRRDKWTCQNCGATDKTLHVHHIRYFWGKDPWDYKNCFLVTLCHECHEKEGAKPSPAPEPVAEEDESLDLTGIDLFPDGTPDFFGTIYKTLGVKRESDKK